MNNVFKGFSKAFFVLCIAFIFLYAFFRYRFENFDFDDIDLNEYYEENNYTEKKDEFEGQKADLTFASSLYNKVNYKNIFNNFGRKYKDFYYGENYSLVKNFPNELYIYIAILNIARDSFSTQCSNSFNYSFIEVDDKIREIFGNVSYEPSSFEVPDFLNVIYNKDLQKYTVKNKACSGVLFGEGHIETKMLDARLNGNYLEIYEAAFYVDYESGSSGIYKTLYHKGVDFNSKVLYENSFTSYDEFDKYKLSFSIDDNYKFYSIEKVVDK